MRNQTACMSLDSDFHEKLLKDFSERYMGDIISYSGWKAIIAETALEVSAVKTEEKQQTESSQPGTGEK